MLVLAKKVVYNSYTLCVAPCPVDCIDMVEVAAAEISQADYYRNRYQARQNRLQNEVKTTSLKPNTTSVDKKAYIQAALLRAKNHKSG